MSHTEPKQGENPISQSRLRTFFYRILSGEQEISGSRSSKLFIEAICDQIDRVSCIQRLIGSPKGLSALQSALRSDITPEFLNSSATALIKYIQARELGFICQGTFLRDVILIITEPPIFWDAFVKTQELAKLNLEAVKCFAWLLLQLISLHGDKAAAYYAVGRDPSIQKALIESPELNVRIMGQKIRHIMNTLQNPEKFEGDSPGGRHDNDFADIRKIAIVPTPDEIQSRDPAYLRRPAEIEDCPKSGRLAMHIDNQFRLLREDMLRDLKAELHVVSGLKKGYRKGYFIEGLIMKGVDCDARQLWSLRLQCLKDFPHLAHLKPQLRRDYFLEHRTLLGHQSLACLTADGKLIALVTLNRNLELLALKPPVICVQLSGSQDSTVKALLSLKSARRFGLIQLNTAVFAYEPVLRQLQDIKHLLLQDEIMLWDSEQKLRYSPISSQDDITKLVAEIRRNPTCELKDVLGLSKQIQLDASQAQCFLAGLTQRLSLVQGPPGTGKSFIGALIAKAIYKFSTEKILVVCYTNHALDQFLEDLLNVGIPEEYIVRLGSYVKSSSRTKDLVLSEQKRTFKPNKDFFYIMGHRKDVIREEAVRLQEAFQDYASKAPTNSDIMEYLVFHSDFPRYYEALVLPEEKNGMTMVDQKGKPMDQFYLLDRWVSGQDAGLHNLVEENFPEVWQMNLLERKAALQSWESDIIKESVSKLYDCGRQYNETLAQIDALYSEKDRCMIQTKRIIGCTTTAAAKYVQTIHSVSPGVVLVEEAGEILESHVLTALGAETGQLIMIGDHKQLRPKAHYDLSVENMDGYDLNRSVFERLILKGYPHHVLSQQHRMRPAISKLVRQLTYPDLTDAPSTKFRPKLRGFQNHLIFLNHEKPEEELGNTPDFKDVNSTSSKRNAFEANMTLRCVRYLGQQGYGTDEIVVLTPYVAQLRLLHDVLAKENDPVLNDLDTHDLVRAGLIPAATANTQKKKLRISTVDNYQGEESNIVVVSLTRCNNRGDIGFLSSPERLNVLISRARNALILIGNASTFLQARKGKELWGRFLDLLKDGRYIYDGFPVKCERHPDRKLLLRCPQDFDKCADGGCNEPCGVLLKCGIHICPSRCHQLSDHSQMACRQSVKSKCPSGHHLSWPCRKGKSTTCHRCESEQKAKEKKLQEAHDRWQNIELQQQEHAAAMAKVEEKIRIVREFSMDLQRSKEMGQALKQREEDLKNAKRFALLKQKEIDVERAKHLAIETSTSATKEKMVANPASTSSPSDPEKADIGAQPAADHAPVSTELSEAKPSPSEIEWDRQKRVENASNDAIDSLMKMTGLEEVKAQVLKIKARIDLALRQNTDMKEERFGIVILGNPGTGKTTVARLYAQFLTSTGVLTGSEFVETSGSRLANDGVAGAKQHVDDILNAGGGAFFLDEAYQLTSAHNFGGAPVLDFLLAEIENQVGKIVFILAGYNEPMEKFFEHNQGFGSRIPYRIQFADYSDIELLQIFGQRVHNKYDGKMKFEGGITGLYARIAVRRLGRGRGREGFGNARALENILARILERQAHRVQRERTAGSQPDDFLLTKEDLIGPEPSRVVTDSAAWKELQCLIGLKIVKNSMQALLDRLHTNYQRELEEKEVIEVSLNRVFLGSPGTGKTSVGKLYGQVLADMGLLSNGQVIVKNPADFVGSALGESEKNTKAILKASEGKVLIIDEAYMLSSSVGVNTSDPYKTAVVDTIVAEVQSTLGEDRCVLLLGYRDKMEEMFQNTNPGLSRRFPLDDAFHFEDFDDDQLRKILELKLKKQCLDATKEAKDVAISMLARARHRPNFGNAGEVENLISHAKTSHQTRLSALPLSARPTDVVFEPQDFDANYNRTANASVNCRELFKDVIGCDEIVGKLERFVQTASFMTARGLDPREYIPFNFIFKGPPGTGKTTTARKMGRVFYDMGFLSTPDVHECSATDLVAGFVGQTGAKTVKLLEKALGKVLFIDEAYRLGEGVFAAEAMNELVDSLTKPRFAGKIIVILAGYEDSMNDLLRVNQGLSSRFSEEVVFANMKPGDCWKFLLRNLQKTGIIVGHMNGQCSLSEIISLFRELSDLPSWGNGRDVETISKGIMGSTFCDASSSTVELTVTHQQIKDFLTTFLAERRARSLASGPKPTAFLVPFAMKDLSQRRSQMTPKQYIAETTSTGNEPPQKATDSKSKTDIQRDTGVPNEIWTQLQAIKKASEGRAQEQRRNAIAAAIEFARVEAAEEYNAERDIESLSPPQENDVAMQEFERRQEQLRLALQRAKADAEVRLKQIREEEKTKHKEEYAVQKKLKEMGVCVEGYRWIRQGPGWRCAGGSHFISDELFEAHRGERRSGEVKL